MPNIDQAIDAEKRAVTAKLKKIYGFLKTLFSDTYKKEKDNHQTDKIDDLKYSQNDEYIGDLYAENYNDTTRDGLESQNDIAGYPRTASRSPQQEVQFLDEVRHYPFNPVPHNDSPPYNLDNGDNRRPIFNFTESNNLSANRSLVATNKRRHSIQLY